MPDDVLAAVKRALAKMTPGPWAVEFGDQGCPIMAGDDAVCVMVANVDDAYGVAALVNAAPALVARVEQAEGELRNIVEARRFNRSIFDTDTEFADWAQNRARAVLHGITPVEIPSGGRGVSGLAPLLRLR